MSVDLSGRSVELSVSSVKLLELLRAYWLYDNSVHDTDIVFRALLCYFKYLVYDDDLISYDAMVSAWRLYHDCEVLDG